MEDKLERSLKELLVTSNVVVLPGFGAFVATDIPAMVDSQNNVIYPPRRKVNYNPDLTTDDGLLTGHYARQERISKDTATEHIAQFVEEVQHRLHRGNPWIVEDLGKFIIDGLNHLNFFPDPDQNFVPQSYGLPEVELLSGAKADYPEIEEVEAVKPTPAPKKEEKKAEKKPEKKKEEKKAKPAKPAGEKKKRSKAWLFILLFFVLLGGGAFAYLTQTAGGKKMAVTLKHKIDGMLGKKEKHEDKAEDKHEEAAVATVTATGDTAQLAENKPAEEHTEVAKEGANYQPRNGSVTFDTPDRLDIEPTKMDKFVKEDKNKKEEKPVEMMALPKTAAPKPAPAKVAPATTAKTAPTKSTTTAKTDTKKPAVAEKTPTKTATKTEPRYNKMDEESAPAPRSGKALKSKESIYSKYQIVVSEYKSIEDAVANSDKYYKMGYDAAVIQFKDGKFGVCLARSSDKARADRMLNDIGNQFGSARIKEY